MTLDELKSKIENALPGVSLKSVRESLLLENPADLPKVADFLKTSLQFDYLSSLTGADYLTYIEGIYHFYSMEKKSGPVMLRVRLDRNKPRIPSLVPVYRSAEFQERETFDMYGIVYEGHPDLRRMFMWDNFEGFPLRKDYQQEDSETLEYTDVEWLEKHGVKIPDEMKKKAEELKAQGKRALAKRPTDKEPA